MTYHNRIVRGNKYAVYPNGYVYTSDNKLYTTIGNHQFLDYIQERRWINPKKKDELDSLLEQGELQFIKSLT